MFNRSRLAELGGNTGGTNGKRGRRVSKKKREEIHEAIDERIIRISYNSFSLPSFLRNSYLLSLFPLASNFLHPTPRSIYPPPFFFSDFNLNATLLWKKTLFPPSCSSHFILEMRPSSKRPLLISVSRIRYFFLDIILCNMSPMNYRLLIHFRSFSRQTFAFLSHEEKFIHTHRTSFRIHYEI